jgi:hypothetical protein
MSSHTIIMMRKYILDPILFLSTKNADPEMALARSSKGIIVV